MLVFIFEKVIAELEIDPLTRCGLFSFAELCAVSLQSFAELLGVVSVNGKLARYSQNFLTNLNQLVFDLVCQLA